MTRPIVVPTLLAALAVASAAHARPNRNKAAPKPAPASPAPAAPAPAAPAAPAAKGTPTPAPKATPAPAAEATPAPAAPAAAQCTSHLVVGAPGYRGSEAIAPAGQSPLAGPPVPLRNLAVVGGALHGHTLYELWTVPSLARPDVIRRYAGVDPADEKQQLRFRVGACAEARFPQISGVAAGPAGSLIVTDRLANAVVRVDQPGQDGCTVTRLAGPDTAADGVSAKGMAGGDTDGAGADARFRSPLAPVVDEAGNVYVLDNHSKVRRIAADADHTVTTVVALPSKGPGNDGFPAMTYLGGKLYVVHLEGLRNTVIEIDPASGATRDVIGGNGGAYPPLTSSVVPGLGAIATDGTRLFITGRAWVWSLTPAGALAVVAGTGADEWKPGYDVAAPRPATELVLPGNATGVGLAGVPGGFLFRGRAGYNNYAYVIAVDCP